ncbi:multidrug resistance-associated protein 1-like isoform X3 [Bacillus rossius redtenbacheri]|uniref:multidrug resistance-associated protein 1-like isoform X3 n=1 Tax=Bacillus rossius redtenbacheri TaxID=93214 RepID=UPI002FDDB44E
MYTPLLNSYCGTKFWDANLTWYTEDPDLTPCFQKTVLVWVPCAFLWLFSPLETYYILHSKTRNVPWNWLNVSKLASSGALVLLSLVELGFAAKRNSEGLETYPVDIYSPLVMLVTLALSVVFVVLNRRNGLSTSGLLFLFWFLLSLCGVPQFRSELRALRDSANPELDRESVVYVIYYPLVLATLLLNCFGDSAPTVSEYVSVKNPCPEQNASFLSKLFFSWFDRLAWRGFRKPLEMKDLWNMNPQDTAREIVPVFDKHWEATRRKYDKGSASGASFQKRNDSLEFVSGQRAKKSQVSILPAIFKTFGPMFLFGSMLKLGQDLLVFVSPQILRLLISFVEGDEPLWKGYLYAVLILVTSVAQTLLLAQYFNRMFVVGMRIRTALISAIYRKALKMSNSARKESTVGEIVNLMSVDAQRFMDITTNLSMVWSAPLQITLAIIFLWDVLGPSVLAGLAVMIILIPVNGYIANKSKTLQIRQMKNKDERVKLMNEVLSGIKVLKLYAWEPSFEEQVLRIRGKEMKVLKQAAYLNAGTSFIWTCAPFLVCAVTFTVFVAVDENNILDAQTAFVSLSLFNILRFAFVLMPVVTVNLIEAGVSVKRMNAFINTEDLDSQSVAHESTEKQPIVVENGSFAWGKEEPPVLRNISLAVSQGSLVAVVGTVGSGKSSLVSALLGEMDKLTGRVNTKGSVAYVQQQAWIQNASLRDNITFGRPLDQTLYSRVVEACALKPDLEMLPAGDQTEIGEKGINLSGGQKQRVSLARAVYSNADLYLMDDPLSAVDSHVGKHIFENVIGPAGMLCKKTRILVTHGITFLPEVDLIVVLKDGEVSEHGNYRQLLERNGSFAEFLRQHVGQGTTSEADLAYLRQMSVDSVGAEGLDCLSQVISETLDSDDSKQGNAISGSLLRQQSRESSRSIVLNGSGKQLTPSEKDKPLLAGEKLIEVEKAETGSVNLEVYTYYLRSVGLVFAVATLLCNAVYQSFAVGANLWLSVWSNSAYRNDVSPLNVSGNFTAEGNDDQTMYLAVYGALGLGQAVATVFNTLVPLLGGIVAAGILHRNLLSSVFHAPLFFFDTTPVGRILNRFSQDVDVLDVVIPEQLNDLLYCVFEVAATLLVISYSTPIFIAVIIPVGIVYYLIQRFYVATSRQLKRLESITRSPIYSHFGESITGAMTIRAYCAQERFIRESEEKVDVNQMCYFPGLIANRWLAVRLEMIGNLIIFFSALFAILGRDTMSPGLVGLSVSYALQITQTLNWLVRMTSDVETNIVAVERIKEYAEHKQEAPWENPAITVPEKWPSDGRVEFKDYKVRYREGLDLVLKGITFTVRGGEKVGIVGRTGAGKSSLTLGLFRIIEAAEGRILIDGVDISQLGLHTLRSRLTIIPQDPVLFSGTLRQNLDPFEKLSDEDVWTALEHAHLRAFVKGLQAGLGHEVSEGGENLSVGQRQLICLARALLRKTKVLVLDEATAAVDLETDDLIQRTIRVEFKDCTILTIAHRINTIMDYDRIIVLDQGSVAEYDQPAKLLSDSTSVFHGMAKDAGLISQ